MQQAEKFKTLGITPPKGCLMYGPPGMSASALVSYRISADGEEPERHYLPEHVQHRLAHVTSSSQVPLLSRYARVIRRPCLADPQMYIGDGAKLVRDAFELAKQKAPAIIFIDELDAIGTKRFDSDKSGDREVQRTMLELLNQLDGFSSDARIKASSLRLCGCNS